MALPLPKILLNAGGILEIAQPAGGRKWEVRLNKDEGPATHVLPATQKSVRLTDLTVGNAYHIYVRSSLSPEWSPLLWVKAEPAAVAPVAAPVAPVPATPPITVEGTDATGKPFSLQAKTCSVTFQGVKTSFNVSL